MKILIIRVFAVLFLAVCFSSCESTPVLYSWGSYESQVYDRLRGDSSPYTQIGALEKDLETILSSGKQVPPGFYAHMGLLYSETGNRTRAIYCFETEKTRFPEAAAYMDFLLKNYGK
jgi:hypothetical protein